MSQNTLENNEKEIKRSLWTRMKAHLIHPELTPKQVAWSFAIGLHICFSPFLGLHTVLVVGLCFAFKTLHRPLVFMAALLNNPWTMVPIATLSAYAGNLLMGRGLTIDLSGVDWTRIGFSSFATQAGFEAMVAMLRPILVPYLLGGIVLSLLAVPFGYVLALKLTRRLRKIRLARASQNDLELES